MDEEYIQKKLDEEFPAMYVGGGSDSRANWAYPGDCDYPRRYEYEARLREMTGKESNSGSDKGSGCLVALVGGLTFLAASGYFSCVLYK